MQRTAASTVPASRYGLAPHGVLAEFYSRPEERQAVVNRIFDDSARHYDRITSLMSLGTGGRYRASVLRRIGITHGSSVLDVACGTGQLAAAAARLVGPGGRVVGVDPSEGMRRIAERRRGVTTLPGTAERLAIPDRSFDLVTMGYALRHVADLVTAFTEMRRVLRPGGRVVILEITPPERTLARAALKVYLKNIVPSLSLLATASPAAMRLMSYYWRSIEECVSPGAILDAMRRSGLEEPSRSRTLGIFNEYTASAPMA